MKPLRGGKGDPEVKWRGQGSRNTALTREQVEELSRYSSRLADAADFPGGHSCLITAIFSIQPGKAQPLGWNGSEGKRQRMGLGKRSEPVTESPTVNQMSFVFSTACSTELVNTVTVRQHTNSGHHLCSMNFPSPLCHLFFFFFLNQGMENMCIPDVQAPFISGEACLAICPRQSLRNLQTVKSNNHPSDHKCQPQQTQRMNGALKIRHQDGCIRLSLSHWHLDPEQTPNV